MDSRLVFPDHKKGAEVTAEELDSISNSFDESLHSRLWGLSPASISLSWFSSAVDVLTFAHSAAKSAIYELKLDDGDSLSSWYLEDSPKVLDICNRLSSEIESLCLHLPNLRIAIKLLRGHPSEEEIHQARDLLTDYEAEGAGGCVKSEGGIEGLIRDLAVSTGMSAPRGRVSPVERVVCRVIRAVSFVTAFLAGVISSALRSSSRAIVGLCVPDEFPWADSVRAIQSAVIVESEYGEESDSMMRILRELDDMEATVKELGDMEASVSHVLDTIDDVAASGGGREIMESLGKAAIGLEKATEAMSDGLYQLKEGVNELFMTVTRMRKEVAHEFRASVLQGALPEKPLKPDKNG